MNKHLPPKQLYLLKVFTLIQLVGVLNCSTITARRRLSDWRAYTSINRNGMFYTLPDVPKFDPNGLWRFHDIFFSTHGNLKQTAIRLVQRSSRGLDGHEISTLVGLPSGSSYLSRLRDIPDVTAIKLSEYLVISNECERSKTLIIKKNRFLTMFEMTQPGDQYPLS